MADLAVNMTRGEALAEIDRLNELLRGVDANRYWEGRWRDAEEECERLRALRPPAAPADTSGAGPSIEPAGLPRGRGETGLMDTPMPALSASAPAGAQPSEEDVARCLFEQPHNGNIAWEEISDMARAEYMADARAVLALPWPKDGKDEVRAALEPFAAVGQWLFARPEVSEDMTVAELTGINGYNIRLTRGHFKAAHRAFHGILGDDADTPRPGTTFTEKE